MNWHQNIAKVRFFSDENEVYDRKQRKEMILIGSNQEKKKSRRIRCWERDSSQIEIEPSEQKAQKNRFSDQKKMKKTDQI